MDSDLLPEFMLVWHHKYRQAFCCAEQSDPYRRALRRCALHTSKRFAHSSPIERCPWSSRLREASIGSPVGFRIRWTSRHRPTPCGRSSRRTDERSSRVRSKAPRLLGDFDHRRTRLGARHACRGSTRTLPCAPPRPSVALAPEDMALERQRRLTVRMSTAEIVLGRVVLSAPERDDLRSPGAVAAERPGSRPRYVGSPARRVISRSPRS